MIFKSHSKPVLSLETIAFADIVVNLFVFFFITFGLYATFDNTHKGLFPIDLPKVIKSKSNVRTKPLVITMDRAGNIILLNRTVPLKKLKTAVNYELSLKQDKNVVIRADRLISLQKFVTVVEIIRTTKAHQVAIETESLQPSS